MTAGPTKRSPLAFVVLALLGEAPMHTYRIQRLIRERGKAKVVNIAQRNSIHQTLDRLLRAGLVRVHEVRRTEGRPQRTVYEITADGVETVHRWLREMLTAPAREYPEFPAAVAFVPWLSPAAVADALRERAAALRPLLAQPDPANPLPRVLLLEDEYARVMARAELDWILSVVDDIEAGRLGWDTEAMLAEARDTHKETMG